MPDARTPIRTSGSSGSRRSLSQARRFLSICPLLLGFMLGALVAAADNWPGFRGPGGQGHSSETELPTRWSANDGTGIQWKTAIPGNGWSSPIVWGNRIVLTATTDDDQSCRVICVDATTGDIRWNTEVFRQKPGRKERKNSYATPTPVTDGERVYVVFGSGSMAALDFDGDVLWTNEEVSFYSRHGLGASPILYRDLLIMPFDGSNRVDAAGQWPNTPKEERIGWQIPWDKAEIVALDTATGQRRWTGKRGLSRIAHVTPNILEVDGRDQLISTAGDVIQGFNPLTGERIWSIYSQGEGVTPSFAMGDGLVFTASGFEKSTIRTVRPTGRGDDLDDAYIAWEQRKGVPSQSSLIYVSPYLYAVTDGGIVTCFQRNDGEIVWQERIDGKHSASPVYADGHLYFLSEEGESVVLMAGPEFKIVARNNIPAGCQASPAIANGRLYLRNDSHLYSIR